MTVAEAGRMPTQIKTPIPIPRGETPEETIIRMLNTPEETLKNSERVLATLNKLKWGRDDRTSI
jgi:hypothetical protein